MIKEFFNRLNTNEYIQIILHLYYIRNFTNNEVRSVAEMWEFQRISDANKV